MHNFSHGFRLSPRLLAFLSQASLARLLVRVILLVASAAGAPVAAQVTDDPAEVARTAPVDLIASPAPTVATLTFFRDPRDRMASKDAYISINGVEIGSLQPGFYRSSDEQPGLIELSVSYWDSPGSCRMTVSLDKPGPYFFEIQHRREAVAAERTGQTIGNVMSSFGVLGPIGGAVGNAMGTLAGRVVDRFRSGSCAGYFEIRQTETASAKRRMLEMRQVDSLAE